MKNIVLALVLAVIILISGVAGYAIGASGSSTETQTTTVIVSSTNFATPSIDTTTTTTASLSTVTAQSSSTSKALSDHDTIQILNGSSLETFAYTQWNSSTPTTFTIANVTFTLWSNSTVTYTGGSCYGPSSGYSGYVIKFSDGSTQTMTTCVVGFNAPMTIRLTNHTTPQAGLLIVPSTGSVYFLVSE